MLRPLFKSDLSALLAIEQAVQVVPWTEETFKTCFQVGCAGWVLEEEKAIVGFIIVTLKEECHILNLSVARAHQGKGLGKLMLNFVFQQAKQQGIPIVYLEVRRSNTRAIGLYRKMQFQLIGERKGYYPTIAGKEDALVFAKSLVEA